jgi:hypothetical protein
MMTDILGEYIKNGLLDIDTDELLQKVKDIAKLVCEGLKKDTKQVLPYVLVALDADTPEGEPVLGAVETIAQEAWKTIRSKYKEMPITLYRAIILQALAEWVEQDDNHAQIVYLGGADVYPFSQLAEKENNIICNWLHYLGDTAEENAVSEWEINKDLSDVDLPSLKISGDKITAKIDEASLSNILHKASSSQTSNNQALTEANRYSPHQYPYHWGEDFAKIASEGISKIVNTALAEQAKGITSIQTTLNKYFVDLAKNMQSSLQEAIQSSVAVERRSQLLWWKETLYSRTLRQSYRNLDAFACVVAMAVDLHKLLPAVYPVSVDYILRESYAQVHKDKETVTLQAFLEWAETSEAGKFLKAFFEEPAGKPKEGRIDLHTYLQSILFNRVDIKQGTPKRLGITLDRELAYADLSVWLLHCLTVKHLTQTKI